MGAGGGESAGFAFCFFLFKTTFVRARQRVDDCHIKSSKKSAPEVERAE